ncbi:MAG: hypothetical protein COV10_03320 [Candidatus Vogelbacteria bacterium CG10_big_fil_rev_8_21_14_0_10_51_16]|uniref:Class F sortase n=1 Tax=Candidatus Vogelbacteria bacterium CG10_big_fil_rev_8_21_14_0_10_51_16 TaxID=1975045 RepID=A0A2H0RE00_9BACT|nr:MAG: hypothetical protein COV10_03320 [Candidatus Vogelbacteria bacterium CG10_big_fil_rev_8_21_14_0_10_51_16]
MISSTLLTSLSAAILQLSLLYSSSLTLPITSAHVSPDAGTNTTIRPTNNHTVQKSGSTTKNITGVGGATRPMISAENSELVSANSATSPTNTLVLTSRSVGVGSSTGRYISNSSLGSALEENRRTHVPVRLVAPAIGLNAPIISVGKNDKGEMAVPSAGSGAVGWYSHGGRPGESGTAVLAAHVFDAFADLHRLAIGNDIYVNTAEGESLRFVIEKRERYGITALSPQDLFGDRGSPRLHLITCAGRYIPALGTYEDRIVLTARLI